MSNVSTFLVIKLLKKSQNICNPNSFFFIILEVKLKVLQKIIQLTVKLGPIEGSSLLTQ